MTIDGLAIQVVLGDPDVTADLMEEICLRMAGTELGFDASSGLGSRQQSKGGGVSRSGRASHVAKAAGKSR